MKPFLVALLLLSLAPAASARPNAGAPVIPTPAADSSGPIAHPPYVGVDCPLAVVALQSDGYPNYGKTKFQIQMDGCTPFMAYTNNEWHEGFRHPIESPEQDLMVRTMMVRADAICRLADSSLKAYGSGFQILECSSEGKEHDPCLSRASQAWDMSAGAPAMRTSPQPNGLIVFTYVNCTHP